MTWPRLWWSAGARAEQRQGVECGVYALMRLDVITRSMVVTCPFTVGRVRLPPRSDLQYCKLARLE